MRRNMMTPATGRGPGRLAAFLLGALLLGLAIHNPVGSAEAVRSLAHAVGTFYGALTSKHS